MAGHLLSDGMLAKVREIIRWFDQQRIDKRPMRALPPSIPAKDVKVYKATADASGGYVTVKAVNADGSTVGDTITLKVLP